jgi:hypothetical protein
MSLTLTMTVDKAQIFYPKDYHSCHICINTVCMRRAVQYWHFLTQAIPTCVFTRSTCKERHNVVGTEDGESKWSFPQAPANGIMWSEMAYCASCLQCGYRLPRTSRQQWFAFLTRSIYQIFWLQELRGLRQNTSLHFQPPRILHFRVKGEMYNAVFSHYIWAKYSNTVIRYRIDRDNVNNIFMGFSQSNNFF